MLYDFTNMDEEEINKVVRGNTEESKTNVEEVEENKQEKSDEHVEDIFTATDAYVMAEREIQRSKKIIFKKPMFWVASLLVIVGVAYIFRILNWHADVTRNKEIVKEVSGAAGNITIIPIEDDEDSVNEAFDYKVKFIDYNKLMDGNSDTVGYIQYKKFGIDYPIVQSNDNTYYLKHNFKKEESSAGWIYLDYRNNMGVITSGTNYVIYGHNMLDGTMFSSLDSIKESSVKDEKDRLIVIQNGREALIFEVFSTYVTGVEFNYIQTDFKNDNDFIKFIKEIRNKNELKVLNDIEVTKDDVLLTLSTCSGASDRRAVHAKLINEVYREN